MEVLPVIEVGDYMEDIISVLFCVAFFIKVLFSNMPTGRDKVINTFMMSIKHNAVRGKESQFFIYYSYIQLDLQYFSCNPSTCFGIGEGVVVVL